MDDVTLTAAMDVVLLWGPDRATPERDRLLAKLPNLVDDDLHEVLQTAHQVLSEAEALAPGIKANTISNGTERLREHRPWLTEEQAGRAIQQGLYAHWRDTGL